jgi:hypothetical protein
MAMLRVYRIVTAFLSILAAVIPAPGATALDRPPPANLLGTYTLPRMTLSRLGNPACSEAVLERARRNGLKFTDLPSLGSGLERAGTNEFWGITDRGPNGRSGGDEGTARRTFPLPEFCPAILRFKLAGEHIEILQAIPLTDERGRPISGLSNVEEDERLYAGPDAKTPLPLDQNGVDPEAIRVLPDGCFLLSEEYSPSILVVATNGRVLVRYTPTTRPLTKASYPVKPILPAIFAQRRINHGFENLALSGDGRTAWAILQSPMGDTADSRLAESRVLRAVQLDVSHPLEARVTGEYLLLASPARDYSARQKQQKISWSDAAWLAPDTLLVLERVKGEARLLRVDLGQATNILGRPEADTLAYEAAADLSAAGVTAAPAGRIFSTREVPGIDEDKLEGVAVLGPGEVALSNDNDFGIGDNENGAPSKVWLIRVPALRAYPH